MFENNNLANHQHPISINDVHLYKNQLSINILTSSLYLTTMAKLAIRSILVQIIRSNIKSTLLEQALCSNERFGQTIDRHYKTQIT